MNDIKVVIELSKASSSLGFGVPLIYCKGKAVKYTEVSSLEEIVTAGFEATSETYKAAQLLFMQNNAPIRIAVFGSSKTTDEEALAEVIGEGWRQLIAVGEHDVGSIATYIASCKKHAMYFTHLSNSDTTTKTAIKGNERVVAVAYEEDTVPCPEAALVGATAGLAIGSYTYKNIILRGVTAQVYSEAEVDAMHEEGVITYLVKAGSIVTSEGLTGSKEYIDIVDCRDYVLQQIEYQGQALLNRVPKLAYDNNGIASLESVVVSVLMEAANNGMIAVTDDGNFDYTVNFAPRSECSASSISARHYDGGKFEFRLAGAIHDAKIKGSIVA